MNSGLKEKLKSILIKITALLAFIAINMISYRAFSATAAIELNVQSVFPICQLATECQVDEDWKLLRILA